MYEHINTHLEEQDVKSIVFQAIPLGSTEVKLFNISAAYQHFMRDCILLKFAQ